MFSKGDQLKIKLAKLKLSEIGDGNLFLVLGGYLVLGGRDYIYFFKRKHKIYIIILFRVIPTIIFIDFLTDKSSGILSDISSGILSGILSGISSGISFDLSSGIFSDILSGIFSGLCSGISSGILSGILSDISFSIYFENLSGILFGISSDILSDIFSDILPVEVWQCPLRSGSRG